MAAQRCKLVLKYQKQWAKSHPVGTAQHLLYTARFQRICGEHEEAMASLRSCLETSERLGLAYHGALASYDQARWQHPAGPARKTALREARRLLTDVGAMGVLGRAGTGSKDLEATESGREDDRWG